MTKPYRRHIVIPALLLVVLTSGCREESKIPQFINEGDGKTRNDLIQELGPDYFTYAVPLEALQAASAIEVEIMVWTWTSVTDRSKDQLLAVVEKKSGRVLWRGVNRLRKH